MKQKKQNHYVQLYRSDQFLAVSLAEYIRAGLEAGEGVMILVTKRHEELVKEELQMIYPTYFFHMERGQLVFLNAEATLSKVLIDNEPDFVSFKEAVGGSIERLKEKFPVLRFYGELVNVLCEQGRLDCAIALEEFWNEVLRAHSDMMLMCGYATKNIYNDHAHHEVASLEMRSVLLDMLIRDIGK